MRHASSASRHSRSVGARFVTTRQSSRAGDELVRRLHEEAAGDLAEVELRRVRGRRLEQPRVLALLAQRLERAVRRSPGAITTSACGPATMRSAVGGVDRAVQRDDAAERGALVALQRALVRGGEVVGDRDAARVGVLDDGARGLVAEIVHERHAASAS